LEEGTNDCRLVPLRADRNGESQKRIKDRRRKSKRSETDETKETHDVLQHERENTFFLSTVGWRKKPKWTEGFLPSCPFVH